MRNIAALSVLIALLLSHQALAGSSGCTATSSLSWSQDNPYDTLTTQCIIDAAQSDSGTTSLLTYLPDGASDGDTFTLVDTTPYALDTTDSYYSDPSDGGDGNTYGYGMPAGFGMEAPQGSLIGDANDGYANSVTLSEFYFISCTDPLSEPCTPEELPSYYSDYPQQRYRMGAVFNASTGNWDDSFGPALARLRARKPLPAALLKKIKRGRKGIFIP